MLAWHLEQAFRENSAAWAHNKCLKWDVLEENLPNFLNELIDCPCTLAQARADTGRFHVSTCTSANTQIISVQIVCHMVRYSRA